MAAAAISAENPFIRTNAMANTSDASGNTGSQPSSISSSDFLTLLVTEMKNQDPTAQTDPNEYVNQLVQVNSLEQLIEINQNLSAALVNPDSGTTGSTSGHAVTASGARSAAVALPATTLANPAGAASHDRQMASHRMLTSTVSGNLSVPREIPAGHRIAHALGGRS